jgi:hypothetical protein
MDINEPTEPIEFQARCRQCAGTVRMMRNWQTGILMPDKCVCTKCSKVYHLVNEIGEAKAISSGIESVWG